MHENRPNPPPKRPPLGTPDSPIRRRYRDADRDLEWVPKDLAPLTIEEVRRRVEAIMDSAGDDEAAHGMEDKLHKAVLATIADHGENLSPLFMAELAGDALRTTGIDFARWCA